MAVKKHAPVDGGMKRKGLFALVSLSPAGSASSSGSWNPHNKLCCDSIMAPWPRGQDGWVSGWMAPSLQRERQIRAEGVRDSKTKGGERDEPSVDAGASQSKGLRRRNKERGIGGGRESMDGYRHPAQGRPDRMVLGSHWIGHEPRGGQRGAAHLVPLRVKEHSAEWIALDAP